MLSKENIIESNNNQITNESTIDESTADIKTIFVEFSGKVNKITNIPKLFECPGFIDSIEIPINVDLNKIKSLEIFGGGYPHWTVPFSLLRKLSKMETTATEYIITVARKLFFKSDRFMLLDGMKSHKFYIRTPPIGGK